MTTLTESHTLRAMLALLAAFALFAWVGAAHAQPKKGGTQSGYSAPGD